MNIITPDTTLDELRDMVSDKEWLFAQNLLLTTNATKAAIEAGYSERTASQAASRMTKKPEIIRILSILRGEREERLQVKQDNVLREIGRIALVDPRLAFDDNNALLPPKDWPDEIAAAISSIKVFEVVNADGEKVGETKEIKFWNKAEALTLAARHLGMLNDKVTLDVTDELADRLARARQRLNG